MLDKESIIEYSERFKNGKLLNEYEKGNNELIISKEDIIDIINNVLENEGIDENYINSYNFTSRSIFYPNLGRKKRSFIIKTSYHPINN